MIISRFLFLYYHKMYIRACRDRQIYIHVMGMHENYPLPYMGMNEYNAILHLFLWYSIEQAKACLVDRREVGNDVKYQQTWQID